jgi:hypothetical protein
MYVSRTVKQVTANGRMILRAKPGLTYNFWGQSGPAEPMYGAWNFYQLSNNPHVTTTYRLSALARLAAGGNSNRSIPKKKINNDSGKQLV